MDRPDQINPSSTDERSRDSVRTGDEDVEAAAPADLETSKSEGGEAESKPAKRKLSLGTNKPKRGARHATIAWSDPSLKGYPESVQKLIAEFTRLPGIGRRSAERLAFHVLKATREEAEALSDAVNEVKRTVGHCRVCYNLMDRERQRPLGPHEKQDDVCDVCASGDRDRGMVMVVEQPKDLIAFEQTGMYKGVYHVLMGRISPLDGVTAGDLTVHDLLQRVREPENNAGGTAVREVVLALNPTMESEGTALYLADQLHRVGEAKRREGGVLKVTRLARGVPTGMQLEFASKAVLADAIEGRRAM